MEAKVHAVDEIRQIVREVFVYGGVGGVHAQQILVARLRGLQPGLRVLGGPLGHLLLNNFVLSILLQLFLRDLLLDLGSLLLHDLELRLGLPELGLVGVVGLHGGVQLVEHLQNLLVDLEPDLTTLKLGKS